MINSKATNLMLIAGIIGFIVMTVSQMLQGSDGGTAGAVAWAASSNDWQWIMPIRLLAVVFVLIFAVGFNSWARSFNESSGLINLGTHFTLIGVVLLWVSITSQAGGFDIASDSSDPTEAAHALIKLSGMTSWLGGVGFALGFFIIGIKLYIDKVGTPILNGLIALLGIIAAVGAFVNWFIWVVGFGLAVLVIGIIGLRKVMRG